MEPIQNKYTLDVLKYAAQQSEAWDKIRLGKFTASTIHNLMSDPRSKADKEAGKLSQTAHKYVVQKAMEILTGESQEDAYGRAIDWGNEWEAHALGELEKALAGSLDLSNFVIEHKPPFKTFNEYSGASSDALIKNKSGDVLMVVEMKCPFNSVNHYMHSTVESGPDLLDVNSDYYYQIQMNCLVHGCTAGIFASYDPRQPEHRRLSWCRVEVDIEVLDDMCQRMERARAELDRIVEKWNEYPAR